MIYHVGFISLEGSVARLVGRCVLALSLGMTLGVLIAFALIGLAVWTGESDVLLLALRP